jgi:NADH-quinone oxidoreductase subunit J
MSLEIGIFWVFGLAVISGAMMVAFSRDLMYAAIGLLLALFAVAGIFVISGADFAGLIQLIVYVGGILILLLFGIMLTRRFAGNVGITGSAYVLPGTILTALLAATMIRILIQGDYMPDSLGVVNYTRDGSTETVGVLTLTHYVLPFEVVSFLLLTALVGAAWYARRKPPVPRDMLKSKSDIA